jgi:murein peptide amidase A
MGIVVSDLIAPLRAKQGVELVAAGEFPDAETGDLHTIWRLSFRGTNSEDPIRIGVFGSIHGDEPAGAIAACSLISTLADKPALAENFLVQVYPVCNPAGFARGTRASATGRDLNREFWQNSPEPEIRILEAELKAAHFQGLVQLHADDTSHGVYGFVRGHTLTQNLLRPALREAGKILPRNQDATIDGFAARDGIIFDQYHGILAAPPDVDPVPFEIVLETPQMAEIQLQVRALETALVTILAEYRGLISFAANL